MVRARRAALALLLFLAAAALLAPTPVTASTEAASDLVVAR